MKVNLDSIVNGSRGVKRYYQALVQEGILDEMVVSYYQSRKFFPSRLSQLFWSFFNFRAHVWSPSHATSILSVNHIVTVHDLINLKNTSVWSVRFWLVYSNLFFVFLFCKKIVCISCFARSQVLQFFPFVFKKTIVVKSPTVVGCVSKMDSNYVGFKELANKQFVLVVSNDLPHKNNKFVLEGLCRKAKLYNYSIVLVGVNDLIVFNSLDTNVHHRVHSFSRVSGHEMDWLFLNASLVVSGSFLEGHNLVIAQALFCGCKVLCSSIDTHKEFYNGFVKFFDPNDPNDFDQQLDDLCNVDKFGCLKIGRLFVPGGGRTFREVCLDYRELLKKIC